MQLLLVTLIAICPLTYASTWRQLSSNAPWSGRSDPQLVELHGKRILLGGHENRNYYNDVWESADGGRLWRQLLLSAPLAPHSYRMAKCQNGHVFLMGGHNAGTWFNDVWSSEDGLSWEQITSNAESWQPRAAAALQIRGADGQMFLMGGSTSFLKPIGNGTVLNDVWASRDAGK
eukprot:gene28781-35728_t